MMGHYFLKLFVVALQTSCSSSLSTSTTSSSSFATTALHLKNPTTRRAVLSPLISGTFLTGMAILPRPQYAAADTPPVPVQVVPGTGMTAPYRPIIVETDSTASTTTTTKLGSRLLAKELSPLNPSLIPFAKDNELFYPQLFLGTWVVTATLRRKTYPYGLDYVQSTSLIEGSPRFREEKVEDSTSYQVRYFSVDGKDKKKGKSVIADRRFNALSASSAYRQLTPVQDVIWDYQKDPTRLSLQYGAGPLSDDMMPLGPRRSEIYVTARQREESETNTQQTAHAIFCASERIRQVTLLPGNVIVTDTETITEYEQMNDDGSQLRAVSRIAVFLTPNPNSREGVLWQQVGGKAVAFFDYTINMQRQ
eukprot:CAMPEP_0194405676 /NCGR_PEP_ID=MMETSP0176-20130528/4011_1 /TAXON_ID=216777 /ORGANISM="Proboscia alata, Strain PI-D3" /LENGTH=363 /DNA_ID=CAMNT_0039204557 /DNA_START=27 /DNA_END=1118 /DNA_ORIENTATION=+